MFRVGLTRRVDDRRVEFRVTTGFRVVSLVAALALVAAGFWLETWLVPLVLSALAMTGALYDERVTFDRDSQSAEFRVGLVLFHRIRKLALADVTEVRVHSFGPAKLVGLEVGLRDGRVMTIENDRGKAAVERLTAWGSELAAWLGVPFEG